MPKRKGHFFHEIANIENAKMAIRFASLGKRQRHDVKTVLDDPDKYGKELVTMLLNRQYTPSPSVCLVIKDGPNKKEREIFIPRFYPDQCIHWMLMLQVEPIIMRGMYEYSCGSIPKRGTKYALDAVHRALTNDPKNCVWCMKLDVEKFYQSINHDCLKAMFRKVIKDPDVLWLIDTIIDCVNQGVPIGYYTSQWFANFYLQSIDHFIKEQLHIPHFVRYVDDILLMSSSKRQLIKAKQAIEQKMSPIGLRIRNNIITPTKRNWEIFRPRETGLEFIGTKFVPIRISEDKHRYIWMRTLTRDTMLRISRRMRRIRRKGHLNFDDASAVISYYGIVRSGNNWRFEVKWMRPNISFEQARKVVSDEVKKQNASGLPVRHYPDKKRIVRCYHYQHSQVQQNPG